jgi:nucleotide-binding universal stress UspA family protein
MMPTHGYGKFRRFLLGSVTARVLHDAQCPVWTAAHVEDEGERPAECREILCAVDGTEKSVPLIRNAVLLGSELSARVRLVHAVPLLHPDTTTLVAEGPGFYTEPARRRIQELQRQAGANLLLCLDAGNVSDVVRKVAIHHEADLIVIGRGRIHERFGGIKTNAYSIIRDSPCPVLSL